MFFAGVTGNDFVGLSDHTVFFLDESIRVDGPMFLFPFLRRKKGLFPQ